MGLQQGSRKRQRGLHEELMNQMEFPIFKVVETVRLDKSRLNRHNALSKSNNFIRGAPMALMTWNEKLSVNIKEIDEQKKWVNMLNNLHEAMKAGRGAAKLEETLSGLIEYTKVHFATEEKLLHGKRYPFYEGHKKIHNDMIKDVESLRLRYESGETVLSVDTLHFLKNWLTEHIMTTDKNYGPYLNMKGVV